MTWSSLLLQRDVPCRVWRTSWNLHWHQILFVYRKNKIVALDQWLSKSGPWATSISSIWECVRPHSRPTESDTLQARPCHQFLKPSQWHSRRQKLENQRFLLSLQITDSFRLLAERRENGKDGHEKERGGGGERDKEHKGFCSRFGHGKGGDGYILGGLTKGEIWLLNLILHPSNWWKVTLISE